MVPTSICNLSTIIFCKDINVDVRGILLTHTYENIYFLKKTSGQRYVCVWSGLHACLDTDGGGAGCTDLHLCPHTHTRAQTHTHIHTYTYKSHMHGCIYLNTTLMHCVGADHELMLQTQRPRVKTLHSSAVPLP